MDDSHIKQVLEGHTCKIETFAIKEDADLKLLIWTYI